MKISVAQTRPIKGDIKANTTRHLQLINLAAVHQADIIIFPELSLTGYEPTLAAALATTKDDSRFDVFQDTSDAHNLTIGIGVPLQSEKGVIISMLIFQPAQPREVYNKCYLHEDELPYFVSEPGTITAIGKNQDVALAICYELSIRDHAQKACEANAAYYLASVAKTVGGVEKAAIRLSEIALTYEIPVLMSNCIGPCEGQPGGGKTGVWNKEGKLVAALDGEVEGIVTLNTETLLCTVQELSNQ